MSRPNTKSRVVREKEEKPPAVTQRLTHDSRKEIVIKQLSLYSRQPFMDLLADFIGAAPSLDNIKEFAAMHPDKWASALRSLATIAGYSEKTESKVDHYIHIAELSDADLLQQLQQKRGEMGLLIDQKGNVLDKKSPAK